MKVRGPEQSRWEHPKVLSLAFQHRRVKSLGHCPQHLLHLSKMNINQTRGKAELRKESGNVQSVCSGDEKCLESSQGTCAV